jgi:hypothetical protein
MSDDLRILPPCCRQVKFEVTMPTSEVQLAIVISQKQSWLDLFGVVSGVMSGIAGMCVVVMLQLEKFKDPRTIQNKVLTQLAKLRGQNRLVKKRARRVEEVRKEVMPKDIFETDIYSQMPPGAWRWSVLVVRVRGRVVQFGLSSWW